MVYDLAMPAVTLSTGIAILATIYLVSNNPGRRRRAWQLLKLLLRKDTR